MRANIINQFTAIVKRENDGYVSLCPELDIASQGDSVEEAKSKLKEVIELFFEHASSQEVDFRLKGDFFVTNIQVPVGQVC